YIKSDNIEESKISEFGTLLDKYKADSNKNALFDSIFSDIHEELEDLNNEISVLQEIYLTDYNSDEESDHETNELSISETYDETSSVEQFHKIYTLYPMRTLMKNEKNHEKRLDKRDDNAFLTKLKQFCCCAQKCLLNINQQAALKRYQEMKAMFQNESNLCFLGIIDASMHATEFKNGIQKKYLTTKYKFEAPKIHGLTGHVSNNAISFTSILNMLKFIMNFANHHGLPSPEHDKINKISISSFQRIWKWYLPRIQFMTAHSDLCMLCKQRRFGAKYWNTNETFQKLNKWIAHYNWAYLEHENYSYLPLTEELNQITNLRVPVNTTKSIEKWVNVFKNWRKKLKNRKEYSPSSLKNRLILLSQYIWGRQLLKSQKEIHNIINYYITP
ncbi:4723_t:CDS:2, partial [Gigaspora margarita]